jgi:hypothetical protein
MTPSNSQHQVCSKHGTYLGEGCQACRLEQGFPRGRTMGQVLDDAHRLEEEFARHNRTATVRVADLEDLIELAYGSATVKDLHADDLAVLSRVRRAIAEPDR